MKETPSITEQTHFPVGFYNFGKAQMDGICYFNCGLVARPDGDWLIVRRSLFDKQVRVGKNDIVAFKLDENVPNYGVKLKFVKTFEGEHYEDPRAVQHHNLTFVSCTNFTWDRRKWSGAHQMLAPFTRGWEAAQRFDPIYGNNGAGIGMNTGQEKNWLWFFQDDAPHLVYSANPHTVCRFSTDFRLKNEHKSDHDFKWKWGQIRGGTPPVLVDGLYWTFFHSSTEWRPPFRQYHMGCYAFEPHPPFRIVRMTQKPILSGSQKDRWSTGKPIVVFPVGSIFRNGTWLVTGGCNDLCSFWIQIPHAELEALVTPPKKTIITKLHELVSPVPQAT